MMFSYTRPLALLACLATAIPAVAQTTSTGTGTTGTTGTTTGTTSTGTTGTTSANSNRVSSSNSNSGFGNNGSTTSGPFQGTVPASFSGSAGTSTATNTGGGTGNGISGVVGVPSTTNPWLTTYGNPYAIGQSVLGAGTASKATGTNRGFGQPIYSITNNTINTIAGLQNATNTGGFNNSNVSKVPRYTSALSEDIPYVAHPPAQLQAKLQDILARSTSIRSDRIQVVVDGNTVVLVGQVVSERDRRIAESMLRLTPGVDNVDNRLALPGE